MPDLETILALTPGATEHWHWTRIDQRFDVNSYLTTLEPPLELVVSVKAVGLRGDAVFVFDSDGESHVLPGGRREPGESPRAALARELQEETGCAVSGMPRPLGILHLRNRSPQRHDPRYRYPYPDTLQWVFVAELAGHPTRSDDPFVENGRFVSIDEARRLLRSPGERLFLDAARH